MHNQQSQFVNEDELEDQLRLAIHRVPPPPGFADAVLHRLSPPAPAALPRIRPKAARPAAALQGFYRLAAVLLLMLLLPLGDWLYQRHRHAQAERAAAQFAVAMRLTHAALVDAGQQVFDHGHTHSTD